MCPDWGLNWHLLVHRTSSSLPSRPGRGGPLASYSSSSLMTRLAPSASACYPRGVGGGGLQQATQPIFLERVLLHGAEPTPNSVHSAGEKIPRSLPSAAQSTARSQCPRRSPSPFPSTSVQHACCFTDGPSGLLTPPLPATGSPRCLCAVVIFVLPGFRTGTGI